MKKITYHDIISYATDLSFGFFFFPFLSFITRTTISIAKTPESVNEGVAILYIALLGGIVYLLRKETIIDFKDDSLGNHIAKVIGVFLFIVLYFQADIQSFISSLLSQTC